MTPEERDLRRALRARSGEPSPQFRARLTTALAEGRPPSGLLQVVAMVVVVAITLGTVGALLLSRNARNHEAAASGTRLVAPTPPTSIAMPSTAQIIAPTSNVVWLLVAGSVLFRSTDQGTTWEQRGLPAQSVGRHSISFIDDHEGWLLMQGSPESQCNRALAVVLHTTDGGAQAEQISSLPDAQCKERIYFYDSTHGFVTAWDDSHRPTIYRTVDGGKTWSGSTLPDPPGFKTSPGGFTLRAGALKRFGNTIYVEASGVQSGESSTRQYMFRSGDGGATWTWLTKLPSPYIAMVTESRWLQLIVPGQSMESTNGGQQWHPFASDFNTDTPVGGPQVVFADSQVGYAEGRGALQRTVDGGLHWVRIATPVTDSDVPPPQVASGGRTNPSVVLLPVSDPGFTCRLAVGSIRGAAPYGGFVAVPRGPFQPDPAAAVVSVSGQRWTYETAAKPVLKGTDPIGYDAPFSRWVPATPEVVSRDGSQYAWTERENDGNYRLHLTMVADGSDRSFDVAPPSDPDVPAAHIPFPLAITKDGVILLSYGWEGLSTVWQLDPSDGSLSKISGQVAPQRYGAGAIWAYPLRGRNSVGLSGDTVARLDLATGAIQDWFHRDNFQVYILGFDLNGNPWVQVDPTIFPGSPQVHEIWRVRGPGQADLILSGQRGGRVTADSHGTWFGNATGVYLYAGERLQRVSAASVQDVVGPCI